MNRLAGRDSPWLVPATMKLESSMTIRLKLIPLVVHAVLLVLCPLSSALVCGFSSNTKHLPGFITHSIGRPLELCRIYHFTSSKSSVLIFQWFHRI